LLNELASLSDSAEPSAFHHLLARLDRDGRLLRCYTQNIDGLESKAGLEVGIPPKPAPSPRKKSAGPSPPRQLTPRCIPLHGQLGQLVCTLCSSTVPLTDHLPLPPRAIVCPTCDLSCSIRHALSERSRKVGTLRASVVLYGEEHPQGEMIGTVVERDLRGTGPKDGKEGQVDLLLVAGTSLSIPGVKRIVKEMARSLHSRPTASARVPSTVLVNSEMPKGTEWPSVFDTFVEGDIQDFVQQYYENPAFAYLDAPQTPKKRKVATTPRKQTAYPTPESTVRRVRAKLSTASSEQTTPTKLPLTPSGVLGQRMRRPAPIHVDLPPTPRVTPKTQPSSLPTEGWSEGPLTPLSEEGMGSDSPDQNPFVVQRR
jgi:NAD-dependent SIR2 family protein deacetylase